MRHTTHVLGMMVLIACVSAVAFAQEKAAQEPQEAVAARQPVYLGKPLSYWTDAATLARSEEQGKAVAALTLALAGDRLVDIVAAADALTSIGPPAKAAAPTLAAKLEDKQPWVRIASMNALRAIGQEAVPAIVAIVEKGSPAGRQRAAILLGSMGPVAKPALPALKKALAAASGKEREGLQAILAEIEQTGSRPAASSEKTAASAAQFSLGPLPESPEAGGGDWPQFHGPNRDSICRETGLLKTWPEGGPKLLWQLKGIGRGYSTVSLAGGRLFTMGDRRDGQGESQFVLAYDLASRKELWATRVGAPHDDGPRCTPTIDGNLLYALGTDGDLVCLETATGKVRWGKNLVKDFGSKMMSGWKYSESPLVDGGRVICTPGGENASLVALDEGTGELVWKSAVPSLGPRGADGAAYSSAVLAEIDGVRQYVQVLGRGVVGIEAASGRFLWGYNRITNDTANITHPLVRGNLVFVTNGYNVGSALLRIVRKGGAFAAEEVYFLNARQFQNHHGGVVWVGDHIYGGSGANAGEPVCIEAATGKIAWRNKAPQAGSAGVLYADGRVIFRYDRGLLVLVEATPEGYRVKGSFTPVLGDGPAWPHPVIHQGKLYLRQNDLLTCYDLRAAGE